MSTVKKTGGKLLNESKVAAQAFAKGNNKFLGTKNALTTTEIIFSSQVDDDNSGGSGSQVGKANDSDSCGDFQTNSAQSSVKILSENLGGFSDRIQFFSFKKS